MELSLIFCRIFLRDVSRSLITFFFALYLFPTSNSSLDLDGFADASMDFEDSQSMLVDESSNQSLQFSDNGNNSSDLDVMESSPILDAPQAPVPDMTVVRGLEREASLHLSEVFNLSDDVPETPPAPPKGPGQLADFLETGGPTNRLAGVRKWIKDKLDEQEDNGNNERRKSLRDEEDESEESSFNDSVNQASGTNFGGGVGGWVPKSHPTV
jgi:hypothetical protein